MRIQPDLNAVEVGGKTSLHITRSPNHAYVIPDAPMAGRTVRGLIELSFLSFQQQILEQEFERIPTEEGTTGALVSGAIKGEPRIVELATIRFTRETALDTIGVLSQHLMQHHQVSKEELDTHINSEDSATE